MRHVEKQPQRHLAKSRGDPPVAANRTRRRAFAFVTLIFVSTFLVYLPALKGGFVWDDGAHVTKPELRGVEGLARIWTELGATQQYYPLLHSVFWIEHRWWGDSPFGYHFINILLHAAAACLLSALLRRLAVPGAGLAGFLFALHPVCVESVAWISEQKNTLSTVLYFCAALAYLRFDANRRGRAYALASALFVLALLTKTVTATLPAALLVIFWWKRGRLDVSRDVLPLVPWLAAGTAMGWVTATVEQTLIGAQGVDFAFTALQRCLIAGRAICFYVGKLIWPTDLVFIYPRWAPDASAGWQYLFPLGVLGGAGFLWWRKQRGMLAGLLVFVGTLSPALGFVNVYPFIFSFVADHFQYPACAAVLVLAAAGTMHATARLPGWSVRMATAFALTALGVLTWRQSAMYRDEFTLYETTLARNSACWMAHNNLAEALAKANRVAEAIPHLERVLEMRPESHEAENNLGDDLRRLGRPHDGIVHLKKALRLKPDFAEARNNLGLALMDAGEPVAAIPQLQLAVRLQPSFIEARGNLAAALMTVGRTDEGIAQFEETLRRAPDYAVGHRNLGLALARSGRIAEALVHFAHAVRLKRDFTEAELNWANVLTVADRFPEAITHYERAIALAPRSAHAHHSYGRALARARQMSEAIAHYEAALRLDPHHAEAHLNLAVALRELGDANGAAHHYREALRLNPNLGSER